MPSEAWPAARIAAEVPDDCLDCGACCFARTPGHLPMSGVDHARLTQNEQEQLTEFRGTRCFMKISGERCVNLQGDMRCSIYERRPQVCRDYEQGGEACAFDRERVYGNG
ncbi:YkgJ family cysteine cluster protein [Planctomycetota bacterium]|nr:YkgJ family cysteine cluster protein [Planctomycetota bacterium]